MNPVRSADASQRLCSVQSLQEELQTGLPVSFIASGMHASPHHTAAAVCQLRKRALPCQMPGERVTERSEASEQWALWLALRIHSASFASRMTVWEKATGSPQKPSLLHLHCLSQVILSQHLVRVFLNHICSFNWGSPGDVRRSVRDTLLGKDENIGSCTRPRSCLALIL